MKLGGKAGRLARTFLDCQNDLAARLPAGGQQPNREDEAALSAGCVVLAWLEQIRRSGMIWPDFAALLEKPKVEDLVSAVQADVVQDISRLSSAFAADARGLLGGTAVLNPTFQGSRHIGGADADVILDETIIDFKCTSKIDAATLRKAALQLLGYVLLDYEGKYPISDLLVYLPRQRDSWRIPLRHSVPPPAEVVLRITRQDMKNIDASVYERLSERRREFRSIVESLR
jgi:hypothetical protein